VPDESVAVKLLRVRWCPPRIPREAVGGAWDGNVDTPNEPRVNPPKDGPQHLDVRDVKVFGVLVVDGHADAETFLGERPAKASSAREEFEEGGASGQIDQSALRMSGWRWGDVVHGPHDSIGGGAAEVLTRANEAVVGKPRILVGDVESGRDPPPTPMDARGPLERGGAATQCVKAMVASAASVEAENLAVIVADADHVAPASGIRH
jgi:hypothetical protein